MQSKVAIYCRLSKEDEEKIRKGDDSESIVNQKLLLMEYAMKQGWQIHEVYSDDDYSGLDKDRPAFNQMIEAAEKRKFDIVLCKNQSRFSRDMELVEKYLHHLFILWNIRFIGVVDNVDTGVKGGKKARQINGLVNEWYCEDLSENVTAALTSKKQSGQYLGHWCTYGYELNPNDRHRIVADPVAADIVREIYELYLSGYGISAIADILTKKQYMTPSNYKRSKGKNYFNPAERRAGYSSKYGVWAINTIRRILRDETYLGHLIQGREKKVSYKSKKVVKVKKEDWIVVKSNHEPIIDEDMFYKVQERLGVKSSNFKVNNGEMPKAHLFAGKIVCMDCGSTMQKRHGKNNVQYLKCGLATKTKSKECSLHTIRMDVLVPAVEIRIRQIIEAYTSNDENAKALMESLYNKDELEKDLKKKRISLAEMAKKQEDVSLGLTNAYMDKVKGKLTDQHFQILQKNFDAEIIEIETFIDKTQKSITELENKIKAKETSIPKIETYVGFTELTHEIVNDFIDYIEVGEKAENGEQAINIYWLF